jgi:hypothetical protein
MVNHSGNALVAPCDTHVSHNATHMYPIRRKKNSPDFTHMCRLFSFVPAVETSDFDDGAFWRFAHFQPVGGFRLSPDGPKNSHCGCFLPHLFASGHTATNTPDLFRTPKLTVAGPGQYWGGGPPGKPLGCC